MSLYDIFCWMFGIVTDRRWYAYRQPNGYMFSSQSLYEDDIFEKVGQFSDKKYADKFVERMNARWDNENDNEKPD